MDDAGTRTPAGGSLTPVGSADARLARLLRAGDTVHAAALRLGPELDLQETVGTVLAAMRDVARFRGGSVCLVEGNRVRMAAASPEPSPEVLASSIPVGSGLVGRVVATGEPVWSHNLDVDPRVDPAQRSLGSNADIRSYLAVPLVAVGEIIGALQIDSTEPHAFDDDDRRVLQWLSVLAAGAIETARRRSVIREVERLRATFLDQITHELRTPVTILQGFAHVLRVHEDLSDAERVDYLERMDNAAGRLGDLIESMLRFARLERGGPDDVEADASAQDVIDEVAKDCIAPHRVEVDIEPGARWPVEPHLMVEAVSMLVDNALKYATGPVRVEATPSQVVVTDQGPGIPADVAPVCMEPFTRGHLDVPGMGVGLAMARSIVEVTGGTLTVGSGPDGGTRAVIELRPASVPAPA